MFSFWVDLEMTSFHANIDAGWNNLELLLTWHSGAKYYIRPIGQKYTIMCFIFETFLDIFHRHYQNILVVNL